MRNEGIGSWPARRARKTPNRVALVHEDREWTYRELDERVNRLAWALRRLGVRTGDRVAYLGPNHPTFLETLFATGALGAVFVPFNTRLAGAELAHILADSGSRVVVCAAGCAETVDRLKAEVRLDAVVTLGEDDHRQWGYESLLHGAQAGPVDERVSLDDVCMIMYTSGTTGRPKGAVLSHGNVTWNSINVLVDCDLASDEVALLCAPLFHTAGLNMTCLPVLLKGGTVVLAGAFEPTRILELIARHRVTFMFGVPAMYNAMAALPQWHTADLSTVRTLTCGGAPVPESTIQRYLDRGLSFVQGYGMTEASPGVLMLDRDKVSVKSGSAGVPHFFTDVRVARPGDPGPGEVLPGERGEILVRGRNVMKGYWGLPDATDAVLRDGGWFHSGDVAVVDDDGYVFIVDRMTDVIISGGENIYPAEVESVLYCHPAVAECAVIGVPDPKWGEVGRAVVVPAPGARVDEGDVLGFLAGRLASYKIPKSVRVVTELPHSTTGKVLKMRLRETHGR